MFANSFLIPFFHRARLKTIPPGSPPEFGNSCYTIRFENRDKTPIFGHRYWFYLKDAVDAPEYIVRWDNFERYINPKTGKVPNF